jgi:hypothetical protein
MEGNDRDHQPQAQRTLLPHRGSFLLETGRELIETIISLLIDDL